MQGKHFVQNLGRRLEAIVLSAAMVLSVITFPAHAEENVGEADPNLVVSLVESGKEKTVDVIANPYGEGTIADEPFINEEGVGDITPVNEALGNLGEGEYLEMEVGITVKEFTSSTENAQVVIYSMDSSNWKQEVWGLTEQNESCFLKLNLKEYERLALLGVRVINCDEGTSVKYTIDYARVVKKTSSGMDEDAVAVLEEAGTIKQGTVSKNDYASDDNYNSYNILDNKFQIPHKLTYGLEGFTSLELQVSVTVNSYTADNNTGNPSVLIYAMNSKYGNWTQDEYEITEAPQTVDLKLDLSVYSTLGEIGLRFGGCDLGTHINYTINYAKVIGEGESNAGVGTLEVQYPLTGETKDLPFSETPVGQHGKLTVAEVEGYSAPTIVDKNGEAYQLRGASSHGMAWFPDYINKGAYQSLRDEWGMNLARITVYAREGGYTTGAEEAARDDALIQKGVQAATELGMYVIIDWHVLNYNPNEDLEAAKAFFTKYVELYGDYDNVLFEICNEPTGTEWYDGSENDLYTYCKTVTKLIRDAGSDAIVICGTNKYSSEVDKVAEKPLSVDGFTNVMYTYHFYAATHYEDEQQKVERALKAGIPVFVSEYGVCTANGDGEYDLENAEKWLNLFDANNVSYACWAMSNSEESAAYFVHDCEKKEGGWLVEDLTNTGRFLVNYYNTRKNILETCQHTEIEVRNQKAATCKEEGFTGDKYCKTCYKPLEMGKVVPKTETHSWNGGVVTTPATETEDGVKTYTCSVCQITKTEKIPATGTTTSQTDAKAPAISKATANKSTTYKANVSISVTAASTDGGTLSYQWYKNTKNSVSGATAVAGATAASYTVPTTAIGTTYYFCKVTNTNSKATGSKTATVNSGIAKVVVKKAANPITKVGKYSKAVGSKLTLKPAGSATYSVNKAGKKVVTVTKAGKVTFKSIGTATITVKAKGNKYYKAATKKIKITVTPKKATLSSVKSTKSRTAVVKWKKDAKATGYQIQYSTSSKFRSAKSVTVKKNATTTTTIKKLKAGKKYYVRVREYKTVGKTKIYGDWSKTKTVKVKK